MQLNLWHYVGSLLWHSVLWSVTDGSYYVPQQEPENGILKNQLSDTNWKRVGIGFYRLRRWLKNWFWHLFRRCRALWQNLTPGKGATNCNWIVSLADKLAPVLDRGREEGMDCVYDFRCCILCIICLAAKTTLNRPNDIRSSWRNGSECRLSNVGSLLLFSTS